MATDGKYEHQMTYAELCLAIEEGRLPYTLDEGDYAVRAADLRRLRPHLHSALPAALDIPVELLDQPDAGQLDFSV